MTTSQFAFNKILSSGELPSRAAAQRGTLTVSCIAGDSAAHRLYEAEIVANKLWVYFHTVLPAPAYRPQGGGRPRVDQRQVFGAIVFVLLHNMAWRDLPDSFKLSIPTVNRWFVKWTDAGLWEALDQEVAGERETSTCRGNVQLLFRRATARRRCRSI